MGWVPPGQRTIFTPQDELQRFRDYDRYGNIQRGEDYMRRYRSEQAYQQLREFRGAEAGPGGVETMMFDKLERVFSGAQNVAGAFSSIAESATKIGEAAERIGSFTLEEAWGIDPTRFDVSVYDEMISSLRDAGIEGEKADAVMRAFGITTGITNAQSEIFGMKMEDLTQQLKDGKITAEEYALAVGEIARQDYSWVDKMLKPPDDPERLLRYYEIIEKIANLPTDWGEDLGKVPDQIGMLMPDDGKGAEKGSIFTPMVRDLDILNDKFEIFAPQWGENVAGFREGAIADFHLFESESVADIEARHSEKHTH